MSTTVNGQVHQAYAEPDMPLLWVLPDLLHMTGTKLWDRSMWCLHSSSR
ncbi:aerobic-type carbon monoxide dehydrogenase small subunit (CoxS/CutS family) [Paraburkholderia caledonica]|uniref:Aerobic-type carbon monoxide dehydrogenase small subunit (CoxS/CutS family) n=1 Tax=Paraburkholderia caledonica TaxID=134536 RepID=A0ABU1KZ31_9BURK|nr:aerobic-type carbon monoxide dehydrogenase small subunit (CoxS/CutS family) [Paraburkholderia caledonica]